MFGSEKKQFEVPLIPHCDGIIFVNSFNSGHLYENFHITAYYEFSISSKHATSVSVATRVLILHMIKIIGFSTDDAFKICLDNWQVKLFNMNIPEGMNE